jgi:tetratricopeptide (TPR) repeat protein
MEHIEKTVFLCYRRTNAPWALAIYQHLTHHGFDVFFDYLSIASGDFEQVILENIKARAHFMVLLTPSALKRCGDPGDWLRREIETALATQRNIVPLMLEGFDFSTPALARHLTGKLAGLKNYNALRVPAEYFDEAMTRLCEKYLNVPLDAVLHPLSVTVRETVKTQQAAASVAPIVQEKELTAQEWFEQGNKTKDVDEQIHCYTGAIRLNPDYAAAYINRGVAHYDKGNLDAALKDFNEAIRLNPDDPDTYMNRGVAHNHKGNLDAALKDYNEAIRLKPDDADAYMKRGAAHYDKGNLDAALKDFNEAIRLKPDDDTKAYHNRALIWRQRANRKAAIADFQKYLDLGGGIESGKQADVKKIIRDLKQQR